MLKIFALLGVPDSSSWPTLVDMPVWDIASRWTELESCPPHNDALRIMRESLLRRLLAATAKPTSPAECGNAVKEQRIFLNVFRFFFFFFFGR